ncbi:MAG: hypothetical protein AB7F59_07735 [Bdellovibrionales bacterium]
MKTILTLFTLLLSYSAQAYKYQEVNKSISAPNLLFEAQRLGLTAPGAEIATKNTMRNWKASTVRKHLDSGAPESLLLEIKAGHNTLEKAKTLARLELFKGAKKNWNMIKNTALNDIGADNWIEFEHKLRRDLDRIEFSDKTNARNFFFFTPWGHALVSKDLKKVSWAIEVSRHLDSNRLEDGVESLVVPEQPRTAPALAPIETEAPSTF